MCGRFANDAKTDELIREYVAEGGDPEDWVRSWAGAYSIAPTEDAPIVRDRGEGRVLELVRESPAGRSDHQRADGEARPGILGAGVQRGAMHRSDAGLLRVDRR